MLEEGRPDAARAGGGDRQRPGGGPAREPDGTPGSGPGDAADRAASVSGDASPASPGAGSLSEADGVAQAKADLRRTLAARRAGGGPRPVPKPGTGASGSWRGPAASAVRARRAAGGGDEITRRVLSLPEVAVARTVAAFASLPGEPDTIPLLDAMRARGLRVLLPALRGDLDLDFREYTGTVVPGAMGTREPPRASAIVELARADVVLVPAVAVDEHGRRLGRGGGSYDRALRRVRPTATLVAVVDNLAIVDEVPVDAHDLSVSIIVTPTRLVHCGDPPKPGA